MSILTVDRLSKSFGSRTLFGGASFHMEEKDRVGLVGANGVGKTTLFRILTGAEESDGGRVVWSAGARIGFMEQHVPESSGVTARDWMLAVFADLLALEGEMESVQRRIEGGDHTADLLVRQHSLREQYERAGGLTFRSRVDAALNGLGFTDQQKQLPLASLSGGQRSKISLARLLVSRANFLLLDEPTNHLDIAAIGWLEEYLRSYAGAFIVVSHDRYFLDRVTTATMELAHEKLWVYAGNYTAYLALKKERQAVAQSHYKEQSKEIRRLEESVEEMRRWNREKSIKRAESKQKVIDKLTHNLEKPEGETDTIHFTFSAAHPGPTEVLAARGLSLSFGPAPLYQNVDLDLRKGERVFLIGANGCGKTTLLKHLTGQIAGGGVMRFGAGVRWGYYDQTQQQLHAAKTVLEEVWDAYPAMTQTAVRSALAAFLFTGDQVFRLVSQCSGGERARISLLKTMLSGCNLLLLDEPTNHLDVGSREALEDALKEYDGTLLMVSHDRYLIRKLAHRVLWLTPNGLRPAQDDPDDFMAAAVEQALPTPPKEKAGGRAYQERKQRESELRKLTTAVARAEEEIHRLEQDVDALRRRLEDPAVQTDYQAVMELTAALDQRQKDSEEATDRWAALTEQLEAAQT